MADPYNARLTFLCKDEPRIAEILGKNWKEDTKTHFYMSNFAFES